MSGAGDFYVLGEGHYCLKAGPLSLEIDRLYRDRNDLTGELSVRHFTPDAPAGRLISLATFNLAALRTRQERAKHLEQRARIPGFDHYGVIEELCQRVIDAERQGRAVTHLRDVAPPGPAAMANVGGIPLALEHPTCFFGDGASLKSLLALWVAGRLQQSGIRVLYVDWEFSEAEHRGRFGRMFSPMPDVLYYRADRPLVAEVDGLRRIVRAERVGFMIVDSVAFAVDGPPESAEIAGGYFRALRRLGVGSLHIAHVSKAEGADQKPFGSVFWHNGLRSTWFVERSKDQVDPRTARIALFHRKSNLGPLLAPLSFEFTFDEEQIDVRGVDVEESADFACKVPIAQRVASRLRRGPMTVAGLAAELDEKIESIDRTVRRYQNKRFTRVDGPDGIVRIALLDRRSA